MSESPLAETGLVSPDEAFYPVVPALNVELTSRCNLKCPYCGNGSLPRAYGEMDWSVIRRIADQASQHGYRIYAVHGVGEPLLRRDLEEILSFLRDRGVWIGWIATNGTLLTAERAGSLMRSGLQGVYVSLDTMNPDLYARTRGGRVDRVLANLRSVLNAHPTLEVVVGLMSHREQSVNEEMIGELRRALPQTPRLRHDVAENGRFPSAREDWRRLDASGRPIVVASCKAPASFLTIAIDGRASLCCTDQGVLHQLGDVRRQTIAQIWYDRSNQATFRRIGLGLSGSPDVCYRCVLNPASTEVEDVDPALTGTFSELERSAQDALEANDRPRAARLFHDLRSRDPWSARLQELLEKEFGSVRSDELTRPPEEPSW